MPSGRSAVGPASGVPADDGRVETDGKQGDGFVGAGEAVEVGDEHAFLAGVLIADERDPDSAGMRLADQLGVTLAPFFVVREDDTTRVYTLYFKFVKEVFEQTVSARSANRELLENNPDLDFI